MINELSGQLHWTVSHFCLFFRDEGGPGIEMFIRYIDDGCGCTKLNEQNKEDASKFSHGFQWGIIALMSSSKEGEYPTSNNLMELMIIDPYHDCSRGPSSPLPVETPWFRNTLQGRKKVNVFSPCLSQSIPHQSLDSSKEQVEIQKKKSPTMDISPLLTGILSAFRIFFSRSPSIPIFVIIGYVRGWLRPAQG